MFNPQLGMSMPSKGSDRVRAEIVIGRVALIIIGGASHAAVKFIQTLELMQLSINSKARKRDQLVARRGYFAYC
jgi:hypothetical protein